MKSQLDRDIDRVHRTMGIGKLSDAGSVQRAIRKLTPARKHTYTRKDIQAALQEKRLQL